MIDLNDPTQLTVTNVAALISSKDDSMDRQVRVSNKGIAYLSDITSPTLLNDVQFRYEIWAQGKDYCGRQAASNKAYVKDLLDRLVDDWENKRTGLIDK